MSSRAKSNNLSLVSAILTPAATAGASVIPLSIIWLISLWKVRKRDDKARIGARPFRVALLLWIIVCLFYTGYGVWGYFYYRQERREAYWVPQSSLDYSFHRYRYGIRFAHDVANVLILATILELATGLYRAGYGHMDDAGCMENHSGPRYLGWTWGIWFLVSDMLCFGLIQGLLTHWEEVDRLHFQGHNEKTDYSREIRRHNKIAKEIMKIALTFFSIKYIMQALLAFGTFLLSLGIPSRDEKITPMAYEGICRIARLYAIPAGLNFLRRVIIAGINTRIFFIYRRSDRVLSPVFNAEFDYAAYFPSPSSKGYGRFKADLLTNWCGQYLIDFSFALVIFFLLFDVLARSPENSGLWSREYVPVEHRDEDERSEDGDNGGEMVMRPLAPEQREEEVHASSSQNEPAVSPEIRKWMDSLWSR